MKNSLSCLIIFCVLGVLSNGANAIDLCSDEFKKLPKDDLRRSISLWKSFKGKCSGTGIYESRLASLYMELGDYGMALPIIQSGISLDSDYEKELLSALANYYILTDAVKKSSEIIYDLINKYPDWHGGYLLLSVVKGE